MGGRAAEADDPIRRHSRTMVAAAGARMTVVQLAGCGRRSVGDVDGYGPGGCAAGRSHLGADGSPEGWQAARDPVSTRPTCLAGLPAPARPRRGSSGGGRSSAGSCRAARRSRRRRPRRRRAAARMRQTRRRTGSARAVNPASCAAGLASWRRAAQRRARTGSTPRRRPRSGTLPGHPTSPIDICECIDMHHTYRQSLMLAGGSRVPCPARPQRRRPRRGHRPSTRSCSPPNRPRSGPATPTSPSTTRRSSWCSSRTVSRRLGLAQPSGRRGRHDRRGGRGRSAAGGRRAGHRPSRTTPTCCYAVQDKVWVDGPDGEPWEVYTVLADADTPGTCGGLLARSRRGSPLRCRPSHRRGPPAPRCC